jgi:hypothetical protein
MSDLKLDWMTMDPVMPAVFETDPLRLVAQRMLVALQTTAGTYWLDASFGLRLDAVWLVKAPDFRLIEADLRRVVNAVPGVLQIPAVRLTFDAAARVLRVGMDVRTDAGVLTLETVQASEVPEGDALAPGRFFLLLSGPAGPLGLAPGLFPG